MPGGINLFESVQFLEPKCPRCENKIEYGVSTKYNTKYNAHVCNSCGLVLK